MGVKERSAAFEISVLCDNVLRCVPHYMRSQCTMLRVSKQYGPRQLRTARCVAVCSPPCEILRCCSVLQCAAVCLSVFQLV